MSPAAILVNFLTEDQDSMCNALSVEWTITPRLAPQPWTSCNRCGGFQPFESSGKTRLNANGKKLDARMIYKCRTCGKTWNRPIFQRRNIRTIDPAVLEALQSNDSAWIRLQEFDVAALRREAGRVDEFADVEIVRKILNNGSANAASLRIELVVPLPTSMRLDRLLAAELSLTRTELQVLRAEARLKIDPDEKDILRRRLRNRTVVTLSGAQNLNPPPFRKEG